MRSQAKTPDEYVDSVPPAHKAAVAALRKTLKKHLPKGFAETMGYGMLCYVVPLKTYPAGYLGDPATPLGFISVASQKDFVAFYHMGLYGDAKLLAWFREEFAQRSPARLDMGKSCVRFKKPESIPLDLIAELAGKITPKQWISRYEEARRRA